MRLILGGVADRAIGDRRNKAITVTDSYLYRAEPVPTPGSSGTVTTQAIILGGAGLAMIIGPFLPWVTATAPFVGTISRSGMDYGEVGIVTMAGIALLALTCLLHAGVNAGLWWPVAAVLAAGGEIVNAFATLSHRFTDSRDASNLLTVRYGPGLYLATVGAVAAAAVVLLLASEAHRNRHT